MRRTLLALATVAALSGCATSSGISRDEKVRTAELSAEADRLLQAQPVRNPQQRQGAFMSDLPFVDPTPVSRIEGLKAPARSTWVPGRSHSPFTMGAVEVVTQLTMSDWRTAGSGSVTEWTSKP